jgi:hypothetical protein
VRASILSIVAVEGSQVMSRTFCFAVAAVVCAAVASLFATGQFAQASSAIDEPDDYVLVDPNIDGNGTPGMVFEENMAAVRRVGTGHYCLRSMLTFDHGPVARVSVDGPMPRDGFAVAVSDLNAKYCARGEAAVATYTIIRGRVRLSNNVRFVGNDVG